MAHLPVVAVICKIHFRPDQKDFAVQADDSAVVSDISVLDGHYADVSVHIVGIRIVHSYFQYPTEYHCRSH